MRIDSKKITVLMDTAVPAMGVLTGCSGSVDEATTVAAAATVTEAAPTIAAGQTEETSEEAATSAQAAADLSGSISMVGSISMERFTNTLSESFMEKYPKVMAIIEFMGSSAGVRTVNSGSADIGNSSKNLKDEEKANGVAKSIVAIDGIAVVVNPSNTMEDLTGRQLLDLYEGKVINWKGVGGGDASVAVVGREFGSDTKSAFEELLGLENFYKYSSELNSIDTVMAKVTSTPGSIGYVSLDVLDNIARALKLEGAESTEENIKARSYFLSRSFVMATKDDISQQGDLVKALFDYIHSEEGTEIAKSAGLIVVGK